MEHISSNSSNIASRAYDPQSQVMEISFKNGRTYVYHGVSQDDWDGFSKADEDPQVSTGSYFHKNVKSKYQGKPKET